MSMLNPEKKLTVVRRTSTNGKPRIRFVGTRTMTPSAFYLIEDNPRQRNTEERAKRATHLLTPHPAHVKVNIARLPDGTFYKLDGHTRAYIWHQKMAPAPAVVHADIWDCRSIEDVVELYGTFDNRKAVETVGDQVYGAKRELELEFKSPLLRGGRYAAGIRLAYSLLTSDTDAQKESIYDLTRFWEPELLLLDTCDPAGARFPTGIIAAALLTLARYDKDALSFWRTYAKNGGVKDAGGMDGVQALDYRVTELKNKRHTVARLHLEQMVGYGVSAFEAYREGYIYTRRENGMLATGVKGKKSLDAWIKAVKAVKEGLL